MDDPNSGTEPYDGHTLGNRPGTVMADGVSHAPNENIYRLYPILSASFDAILSRVTISASTSHDVASGNPRSSRIAAVFHVEGKPFTSSFQPISTAGFRSAISRGSFITLEVLNNGLYDPVTQQTTGGSKNKVTVTDAGNMIWENGTVAVSAANLDTDNIVAAAEDVIKQFTSALAG